MFTLGKLSLCAPFVFLAPLFESLHFFLAFLVRNGHQAPFQICADRIIVEALQMDAIGVYLAFAYGFAVILIGNPAGSTRSQPSLRRRAGSLWSIRDRSSSPNEEAEYTIRLLISIMTH